MTLFVDVLCTLVDAKVKRVLYDARVPEFRNYFYFALPAVPVRQRKNKTRLWS